MASGGYLNNGFDTLSFIIYLQSDFEIGGLFKFFSKEDFTFEILEERYHFSNSMM